MLICIYITLCNIEYLEVRENLSSDFRCLATP